MSALTSRNFVVGLWLYSVHKVREFDGILDKKYRDVISDDVPVTLMRVEFDRKPANIANRILWEKHMGECEENKHQHTYRTSSWPLNSAEPDKHGGRA